MGFQDSYIKTRRNFSYQAEYSQGQKEGKKSTQDKMCLVLDTPGEGQWQVGKENCQVLPSVPYISFLLLLQQMTMIQVTENSRKSFFPSSGDHQLQIGGSLELHCFWSWWGRGESLFLASSHFWWFLVNHLGVLGLQVYRSLPPYWHGLLPVFLSESSSSATPLPYFYKDSCHWV